jgi:hypothetical protein
MVQVSRRTLLLGSTTTAFATTAPGVTLRSSAARLKLRRRATASNARKELSGGSDFTTSIC